MGSGGCHIACCTACGTLVLLLVLVLLHLVVWSTTTKVKGPPASGPFGFTWQRSRWQAFWLWPIANPSLFCSGGRVERICSSKRPARASFRMSLGDRFTILLSWVQREERELSLPASIPL